jgi:glutamate-ammonia-ligase adenylyltransferase
MASLAADLGAKLAETPDYERKLDAARAWMKEWHFRIGVHHLRGLIDAFEAGKSYADLAEAVIAALWPVVTAEFALKHGEMPGRGAVVLGMGSLGAGRLNSGSDLDLILIYDAAGVETSGGPRPLAARPYYARLTQAMVTALSAQTAEGRLYEVDVRLRPSGRQGPVATAIDSFRTYQETEAWTWEHLALTRARVLAGDPGLGAEVEEFRRHLLSTKGPGASVLADVADMRRRLAEAKPGQGGWDAKFGPGRLMDIELLAQTLALQAAIPARQVERQITLGAKSSKLSHSDQEAVLDAYRLCWRLHCAARLLTDRTISPESLGEGGRAFLLRDCGVETGEALSARVTTATALAARVIDAHLQG